MMRRRREPAVESIPNLAPMVDVIMVLLDFFLMGASFNLVREGALKTELDPRSGPGAGAAIEIQQRVRILLADINNGENAGIRVMDDRLPPGDFEGLRDYLTQRRKAGADADNPVVVTPEENVRWDFVVKAMDASISAGFGNVQFSILTKG